MACLAFNVLRAAGAAASVRHAKARWATLRTHLIAVPARIASSARKLVLHLPMSCLTGPAGADPSDRKGITIMTNQQHGVGEVDSHKDTIHVAVITQLGRLVADHEFPTTIAGYRRAVAWLIENGPLAAVGIEGTSSYGVGIAAAVTTAGMRVVEVNRTRPAERRKQGKTDRLDAYRAARSVLFGGRPPPTPSGRASNPCGH